MYELSSSRRVKLLRDSVARKIAAGEVIDRPHAVVRELLDNAIDAGSTAISVYIENGGISTIRVTDNGWGMTREDLENCYLPHATSKIETVEDIYEISSLGFRGEALSSIAACAKLTITSAREGESSGWKLNFPKEEQPQIVPVQGVPGTIVEVKNLFNDLPGRRKFLKKPSAEASMIRQVFLEKSLPFPNIWFRLYFEGELRINLPAGSSQERILAAYPSQTDARMLFDIHMPFENFTVNGVFSNPSAFRKDRRYIHVYVNNRRVNEFALVQAVEYGFSSHLPGGSFPVGFLFLTVNPEYVDFNIHPAKREVKFKQLPEIHRAVVRTIQTALQQGETPPSYKRTENEPHSMDFGFSPKVEKRTSQFTYSAPDSREQTRDILRERLNITSEYKDGFAPSIDTATEGFAKTSSDSDSYHTSLEKSATPVYGPIQYKGQIFNLFLLFEVNNSLFILDQHAAHERILYNKLIEKKTSSQKLLIPARLNIDYMSKEQIKALKDLNCHIEKEKETYILTAVPEAAFEKEIKEFIEDMKGTVTNLKTKLYANMACKKAIKDGEVLDNTTAVELIEAALTLPEPRCPHGRPIWFSLSREELFQLLGRT